MSIKVGRLPQGFSIGPVFDDGIYDFVRMVRVGVDAYGVAYLEIEYQRDGEIITMEHGDMTRLRHLHEFPLNHPDEYITSVQAISAYSFPLGSDNVRMMSFTTSHGRTSPMFGIANNRAAMNFTIQGVGGAKLVGFHGKAGQFVSSIGARFVSSVGVRARHIRESVWAGRRPGDGNPFNDGIYDGVSKVTTALFVHSRRLKYVSVEYVKGQTLIRHSQGSIQDAVDIQEFVLHPNEHITSIGFSCDDEHYIMTSLTINTSRGRSSTSGQVTTGNGGVLGLEGFKLVGVYGGYDYTGIGGLVRFGGYFAPVGATPFSQIPEEEEEAEGGEEPSWSLASQWAHRLPFPGLPVGPFPPVR